ILVLFYLKIFNMEPSKTNIVIPDNIKGKATDLEHSVTLKNRKEAVESFGRACKRMLNVNLWHNLTGSGTADFSLKNKEGHDIGRLARVGDYFQIDIPGPGLASGDGYDWVRVETIEDHADPEAEEESIGLKVRSGENPNNQENETAHFFTSEATSSFIINRKGNTVTASYHGRNELINTETEKLQDKIRNTVVGASALIGISELQWTALIKSFVKNEP
ncbi:MAG: hypothetical protein ABIO81_11080, partial [Ginsengibacter sp.]